MKNQYIGDIGDYGKYGLLRFISKHGIKIGVNWYLSENDIIIVDGKINNYLNDDRKNGDKIYEPELFELLKQFAFKDDKNVIQLEDNNIIPNAVYYHNIIPKVSNIVRKDRKTIRENWHKNALNTLNDVDLIFADPDNGSADDKLCIRKNGEKYAGICELADYYKSGKDIVYYCHKARRNPDAWKRKILELNTICAEAKIIVLTFHRGTQRSFIFGIHPEKYEKYSTLVKQFLSTNWGTVKVDGKKPPFSKESI